MMWHKKYDWSILKASRLTTAVILLTGICWCYETVTIHRDISVTQQIEGCNNLFRIDDSAWYSYPILILTTTATATATTVTATTTETESKAPAVTRWTVLVRRSMDCHQTHATSIVIVYSLLLLLTHVMVCCPKSSQRHFWSSSSSDWRSSCFDVFWKVTLDVSMTCHLLPFTYLLFCSVSVC